MEARSVIEVVEYDEAWPVRAAAARADLVSLGVFDAVEHIGSTSVPRLAAKPVVDLMAAAASLDAVSAAQDALAGLGYRRFEAGMPGRLFYYRDARTSCTWCPRTPGTPATSGCYATTCALTRTTPAGTPS
jgi:GrpB-like predicted nucleotidyltransferase (UPF0157 family)